MGSINKKEHDFNELFKIRTVHEIKSVYEPSAKGSRDLCKKSSRKLFVSVSKKNRNLESK